MTVLDEQHAEAVIEHRQRIKSPLTAHAAQLLAGKFGKCPHPNEAADVMICNGWRGFEPSWLRKNNSNKTSEDKDWEIFQSL